MTGTFGTTNVPTTAIRKNAPVGRQRRVCRSLHRRGVLVLASYGIVDVNFSRPDIRMKLLLQPARSDTLRLRRVNQIVQVSPRANGHCNVVLSRTNGLRHLNFPRSVRRCGLPRRRTDSRNNGPTPAGPYPRYKQVILTFVTGYPSYNRR